MAEQPLNAVGITDWRGQISNASDDDVPPGGAVSQRNLRTHIGGKIQVRGGLQRVTFSNQEAAGTEDVIGLYNYQSQLGNIIVIQLTDGEVIAGKGAT